MRKEMVNVNNMPDINKLIEESVMSDDVKSVKKMWNNTAFRTIIPKRYSSKSVPDEQFFLIQNAFNGMKEATKWSDYKRHFDMVVKLCHIPPEQCIIRKYKLKKGKTDKNRVTIEYANARTKITIPSGCKLYHKSPVDGIRELVPQFKGRSAKGHLYSNHRLYFSIHKDMGKSHADIVKSDVAHTYEVIENIRVAYVDPLVPFHMTGAVYVDTTRPIKVKSLADIIKQNKSVKESTDDEISNDDCERMSESVISDVKELLSVRKEWTTQAKKITHETKTRFITEDERDFLKKHYDIIKSDNSFIVYKKSFDYLCKFFGLAPDETIIEHLYIGKEEVKIKYSSGRHKIIIPTNVTLLHVSPVDNIKELEPSFKSKTSGKYMYSSNRVFFTLGRSIPSKKAGLENKKTYQYTPVENIRVAYIDQSYTDYKTGAVYVETPFPIKVKKLGE